MIQMKDINVIFVTNPSIIQGVSLLSVKSNLMFFDLSNHHKLINIGLFSPELKHNFAEMGKTSQT